MRVHRYSQSEQLLLALLICLWTAAAAAIHDLNDGAAATPANAAQLADAEAQPQMDSDANEAHIRKKRLVWITDDGRLALPPGTSLTFTPTIAMPMVRHPPEGFFSNLSISFPVTSELLLEKLFTEQLLKLKVVAMHFQLTLTSSA